MDKVLDIDLLFEDEAKAGVVGRVSIGGVEYELRGVNLVEDFMLLIATTRKAMKMAAGPEADLENVAGQMDDIRKELRRLIRCYVPGVPDDLLAEKYSTLSALHKVFMAVSSAAASHVPESLKKNSSVSPSDPVRELAETTTQMVLDPSL